MSKSISRKAKELSGLTVEGRGLGARLAKKRRGSLNLFHLCSLVLRLFSMPTG